MRPVSQLVLGEIMLVFFSHVVAVNRDDRRKRQDTNPSGGKLGKLGLTIGGPLREVMLVTEATEATLPALSPLSGAACPPR